MLLLLRVLSCSINIPSMPEVSRQTPPLRHGLSAHLSTSSHCEPVNPTAHSHRSKPGTGESVLSRHVPPCRHTSNPHWVTESPMSNSVGSVNLRWHRSPVNSLGHWQCAIVFADSTPCRLNCVPPFWHTELLVSNAALLPRGLSRHFPRHRADLVWLGDEQSHSLFPDRMTSSTHDSFTNRRRLAKKVQFSDSTQSEKRTAKTRQP
jgi:hypothetical protein